MLLRNKKTNQGHFPVEKNDVFVRPTSHGILLFSGHDFDERYFAQYKGPPCYTNGRGHYPIEYSVIVNAG